MTKTVRVVSLAYDGRTGPPLHSYQILGFRSIQGYRSYGAQKDASKDGLTDGRMPC